MSAECFVTQQLAYFYPQPYESPNRARSRMLSTSVRRDVVHEVCSSSWERKPNWLAVGELVLRTAVCCAPQARAKAVSGIKKPAFGC